MQQRKLTKADIDKVRHIEGFPIAKDEDIIALSRPPYYTACPNPFIEDFIREHGTPYDEATDDYHREPFAADVSEGKNDPIYNAHSYHTKVPHKAIMRYILHYTKPGDIVFDGFCGTGMTGVAAQMCGCPDFETKEKIEAEMTNVNWGTRKVILNDIAPIASFISYNYNTAIDVQEFEQVALKILSQCENECGWLYVTQHVDSEGNPILGVDGKPIEGRINFSVFSDVIICPSCTTEIIYYDVAVDEGNEKVSDVFICPKCKSTLKKRECEYAWETRIDNVTGEPYKSVKQKLVRINYSIGSKRYVKKPDKCDIERLEAANNTPINGGIPLEKWFDGDKTKEPINRGYSYVHQLFTPNSLIEIARYFELTKEVKNPRLVNELIFTLTASMQYISKMRRFRAGKKGGGPLPGTLYVASLITPPNPLLTLQRNCHNIIDALRKCRFGGDDYCQTTQSLSDISNIPENSIDYIFTDPPFGGNLSYSDLNYLWETWLGVKTNNREEAIISRKQKKALPEYQAIMERCFVNYYRILKPNRWITIEFHNSQNSVWNSIQESIQRAGFIVADVRIIDKKQGSFNQVSSQGAVQQDLVISAYKPKESFVREFQENAGDPEMAWEFVRQHLRNVPVTADGNRDGKLDIIAERQDYLLFDRMVAWHIMNGVPVPMDAHSFYEGLRQRFLQRDGMFFLPDQVNEYDEKRIHMQLDEQQTSFIVSDEKNAIAWLNYMLRDGPMTYQQIQPKYLQELHASKQEKMPELLDMLKENFVQDEKGAWYIPDLTDAADLAKLRRRALLKEFYDSCVPGKGKLKVFRMEAIRAGFDECWKQRDFATIVKVGERLPEAVLQEDPALLMYYDNACSRV